MKKYNVFIVIAKMCFLHLFLGKLFYDIYSRSWGILDVYDIAVGSYVIPTENFHIIRLFHVLPSVFGICPSGIALLKYCSTYYLFKLSWWNTYMIHRLHRFGCIVYHKYELFITISISMSQYINLRQPNGGNAKLLGKKSQKTCTRSKWVLILRTIRYFTNNIFCSNIWRMTQRNVILIFISD